jgi:hypothetical protein
MTVETRIGEKPKKICPRAGDCLFLLFYSHKPILVYNFTGNLDYTVGSICYRLAPDLIWIGTEEYCERFQSYHSITAYRY